MMRICIVLFCLAGLPLWSYGQDEPCDPPLVASILVPNQICAGTPLILTFQLPDDDDNQGYDVTYSVDGNTFILSGIVNGHTEPLDIPSTTVITLLQVTNNDDDDDECFTLFNQSYPVAVSAPELTQLSQVSPGCSGANGSITVAANGGVSPYLYQINGGVLQNSGNFSGLGVGVFNISVQDAAGCNSSMMITLEASNAPIPVVTMQSSPDCGQTNGSISVSVNSGVPPFQFSINGGTFQNSGNFTGLAAGEYLLTIQDAGGCIGTTEITLNSMDAPSLSIVTQTEPGCGQANGTITLSASGGAPPYQFSLGGVAYQNNPVFGNLSAGIFQVYVRDANNCTSVVAVTMSDASANLPAAIISSNLTQVCSGDDLVLNANLSPGVSGVWSTSNVPLPSPSNPVWVLGALEPGNYNFTWTLSAPGCPAYSSATISVQVLPSPVANTDGIFNLLDATSSEVDILVNDQLTTAGSVRIIKNPSMGVATINSQNILDYQPFLSAVGFDTVVYEVCLVSCPDACDTALVIFRNISENDPCTIVGDTSFVFTNGLTPNGDGNNDFLVFKAVSEEACLVNYEKSEIIIYNRWGDVLYEASPYNNDWAGKNRNKQDLPPGVYYFVLRITLDKTYSLFGSVILIR